MADSLFDPLLSLEEDFYQEGYEQGEADGLASGRLEGRGFGLQKGFEKFLELGLLQGRASVWKARIPGAHSSQVPEEVETTNALPADAKTANALPEDVKIVNARAQKNIEALAVLLTNPPFKNDEDSVEEVDETLKRGRAKATIVGRMLGERIEAPPAAEGDKAAAAASVEY